MAELAGFYNGGGGFERVHTGSFTETFNNIEDFTIPSIDPNKCILRAASSQASTDRYPRPTPYILNPTTIRLENIIGGQKSVVSDYFYEILEVKGAKAISRVHGMVTTGTTLVDMFGLNVYVGDVSIAGITDFTKTLVNEPYRQSSGDSVAGPQTDAAFSVIPFMVNNTTLRYFSRTPSVTFFYSAEVIQF